MNTLEQLEWPQLLTYLVDFARTEEGREDLRNLAPTKTRFQVSERWAEVDDLCGLIRAGYSIPVQEIPNFRKLFAAVEKGQMLEGLDLRSIVALLQLAKKMHSFLSDFSAKNQTCKKFSTQIVQVPKLLQALDKAILPTGELADDASPELKSLRNQKKSLRTHMEEVLSKILHEPNVQLYLQDQFYTLRNQKYVIPIRLDGRGRIKGNIVDTSESGQTLFLEPAAVFSLNEKLRDLEVSEQLEMIKILRDLNALVAQDVDTLKTTYENIVALDALNAEALFAQSIKANPVQLVDKPGIDLVNARHPILCHTLKSAVIGNQISLKKDQRMMIISGPNAGGKTVVLKTVALITLMAKAGLLVPCEAESKLFLFENIFSEMGDAQNLFSSLSSFSGHIQNVKKILEEASDKDLILFDELASGTEPLTGSALAQAICESIVEKNKSICFVTTHYDHLKNLALLNSKNFRNAAMEYTHATRKPTYRVILDIPGQSYGLELAGDMGLPKDLLQRAESLRGESATSLDKIIADLTSQLQSLQNTREELQQKIMAAEQESSRWQEECKLLEESRTKVSSQIKGKYQDEIDHLKDELHTVTDQLKKLLKGVEADSPEKAQLKESSQRAQQIISETQSKLSTLSPQVVEDLPGKSASKFDEIQLGQKVYVTSLRKTADVIKAAQHASDTVEVRMGPLKNRVKWNDLRILPGTARGITIPQTTKKSPTASTSKSQIALTLRTPTNFLDLRGQTGDQAVDETMRFIDKAMLRGEHSVILVHGHGSDRLKTDVRNALQNSCPYDVQFRSGLTPEGGDGVTIVQLEV